MNTLLDAFCEIPTTLEDLKWLISKGAIPTKENIVNLLKTDLDLAQELCDRTGYGHIFKEIDPEELWEYACSVDDYKLLKFIAEHSHPINVRDRLDDMMGSLSKFYDHVWIITQFMNVDEVTEFLEDYIDPLDADQLENIISHVKDYSQRLMDLLFGYSRFRQIAKQYHDRCYTVLSVNVDDLLSNPTKAEMVIKIVEKMDKEQLLKSLTEKGLITSKHISELLVTIYRELGEEKTVQILSDNGYLSKTLL